LYQLLRYTLTGPQQAITSYSDNIGFILQVLEKLSIQLHSPKLQETEIHMDAEVIVLWADSFREF
jgi:hypothetical protein